MSIMNAAVPGRLLQDAIEAALGHHLFGVVYDASFAVAG
jgi:hypothetical protein